MKPQVGIKNTGTQLYVSEIRAELYAVLNDIQGRKNGHLAAWMRSGGHPPNCRSCEDFVQQKIGICDAIKHFGGNPNRNRKR